MEFQELLSQSITALTVNKLRTVLATLGIVIGIGSVIALMSLGQASQASVTAQIQSLGSNLLTISPQSQNSGGVAQQGGVTTLTRDDANALSTAQLSSVKTVSPEYSDRAQVTAGRNNTNSQIIGVVPSYVQVHKVGITAGNFIAESDVIGMTKVAVLGPTVAADLFAEGVSPIGQSIRIQGTALRVIGVTAAKGGTGFGNPDSMIFVPLTTAQKLLFGTTHVTSIAVEAVSSDVMTQAQNEIGYLLLARHKITDPLLADFSIFSQNDLLSTVNQVTSTLSALLSAIAAISLLVGGIGIMNIMLVTVTERTREIGLRKALGAKRRTIIAQFLIEATILTLVGGFLGMLIGIVISFAICFVVQLPFTISAVSILLAIGVSAIIGILFGWYPARKAAFLQPIEALRYE